MKNCIGRMLVILFTIFMFTPGLSIDSRGKSFITAFPENVAYYYRKSYNQLKITSLHEDTNVTIYMGEIKNVVISKPGKTWVVNCTKTFEEYRFTSSNWSVRIISDKNITVLSVTGWWGRFQSYVVQPDQNLGYLYQIPALNYTNPVTFSSSVTYSEARRSSFRLIIINAEKERNTVTFKWSNEGGLDIQNTTTLDAFNLFQLQSNGVKEIKATSKVAVLLTHPCIDTQQSCKCSIVLNQLCPTSMTGVKFFVPSAFNVQQLLLTTNQPVKVSNGSSYNVDIKGPNSTDILPSFPIIRMGFSITINKPVSLQLISSGLILDLIPETMFAACYLVHFHPSGSGAFVIAKTSNKNDVRMNDQQLPSAIQWIDIVGTQYSLAVVNGTESSTIWHLNGKIAVYMIDRWNSDGKMPILGGPAITINADPDPNGCMVTPKMYIVGTDEMSWANSRQYCFDKADDFATVINSDDQKRFVKDITIGMTPGDLGEVWISLRRDLFSTAWYWLYENNTSSNLKFISWGTGQPLKPHKGMCASVYHDTKKKKRFCGSLHTAVL
ncbi:uncharacterized protein LOC127658339 [Xyrauchen texanus]|uniref:uncharacterized protein LOC127658339 n=1 Tax=Xyrauchen texanus TaxID=154827 RepID=UPI0022428940|nr:uncharacterized protein LOC127658339 [Xyrauchen texanus]